MPRTERKVVRRVAATQNENETPTAPSRCEARGKAHKQGLLVLAVIIAALAAAIGFVVFVRIG
jgi:hypothetical protein